MTSYPSRPGTSTRDALLDAAEQLFSERGYTRVGIRELAEAAGANIASIKYHFGSKLDLYLETVRRAMQQRPAARAWEVLSEPATDPQAAATQLGLFMRLFLRRVFTEPDDCATCLMLREASQPSEAVDAVVRDFVKPHQALLAELMRFLRPDVTEADRPFLAHCVLAVMLHYRVFRPFLERLEPSLYEVGVRMRQAEDQILQFAFGGLGCSAELVDVAIAESARLFKDETNDAE